MKNTIITSLLISSSLITVANFNNVSQAQTNDIQFTCGVSTSEKSNKPVPTTMVTFKDKKIPLIQWVKKIGTWTPQERCKVISVNLQKAQQDGTLKFLTNGKQNGTNVICAATEVEGPCLTIIMTLRPNDKSLEFLAELKDVLNGRMVFREDFSGERQVYIEVNLEEVLKNSP